MRCASMTEHTFESGYQEAKAHYLHTGLPSQVKRPITDRQGRPKAYYDGWRKGAGEILTAICEASPDGRALNYYAEGTPPGILGTREPFTRTFGPMP